MKIRIFFALLVGLVVGGAAAWVLAGRIMSKVFAAQYCTAVMDEANVALNIRAGKQMELVTNIEASLPEYVLAVDHEFKGYGGSMNALWMVKAYYERNRITVPPEISGILASLPPKPPTACQIRLRALDRAPVSHTNTIGAGTHNE